MSMQQLTAAYSPVHEGTPPARDPLTSPAAIEQRVHERLGTDNIPVSVSNVDDLVMDSVSLPVLLAELGARLGIQNDTPHEQLTAQPLPFCSHVFHQAMPDQTQQSTAPTRYSPAQVLGEAYTVVIGHSVSPDNQANVQDRFHSVVEPYLARLEDLHKREDAPVLTVRSELLARDQQFQEAEYLCHQVMETYLAALMPKVALALAENLAKPLLLELTSDLVAQWRRYWETVTPVLTHALQQAHAAEVACAERIISIETKQRIVLELDEVTTGMQSAARACYTAAAANLAARHVQAAFAASPALVPATRLFLAEEEAEVERRVWGVAKKSALALAKQWHIYLDKSSAYYERDARYDPIGAHHPSVLDWARDRPETYFAREILIAQQRLQQNANTVPDFLVKQILKAEATYRIRIAKLEGQMKDQRRLERAASLQQHQRQYLGVLHKTQRLLNSQELACDLESAACYNARPA